MVEGEEVRIGVYVCHCGINIASVVDVKKVVEEVSKVPNVVVAKDYQFMCSQPGQSMIVEDIKQHNLNRVVVAACSPRMHEPTFQKAVERGGLNPYLFEMANIREHCSWVHEKEKAAATDKAVKLIKAAIAKVRLSKPLKVERVKVIPRALVIGGGIAGIRASLDIANAGFEVHLVETRPSIGGNMARLDKTFPTLDCSQCILTPLMVEVSKHPNVTLHTYTDVVSIDGSVGSFKVKLLKKPRYVDESKCTGCGTCVLKCPWTAPSEFDLGLGKRKAIYFEFPQAVPLIPVIDTEHCMYFQKGTCRACERFCPTKAIDFNQKPKEVELEVGAIILATGYALYDVAKAMPEYGYRKYKDVITGLELERLVSATGPTKGQILRPSDGKEPKKVAIILCVGSRDEKHLRYCCRFGCVAGIKHAYYVVSHIPDAEVYVCYRDIRTFGKGYEEFYERIRNYENVRFIRGSPMEILQDADGSLYFDVFDANTNRVVTLRPDLVVLETGVVPHPTFKEVAKLLKCAIGPDGFALELHPKLRPTETSVDGVFLAGAVQGPKDIPDTVAQAGAAASSAIALMSKGYVETVPYVSSINEDLCSGCGVCEPLCAFDAISLVEKDGGKKVAKVDVSKCKGCGVCAAACPSGAAQQLGFTDEQILAMVRSLAR
ncbi:MAG: disulfide reductase [Candidatus Terraquivivens tikiterensis]|uniref:CoB--CoM heterodisulfide reductase iron-sulfur subunit A n=1 Tax=Candidatus Terraquivivens tikiterensis TaxID=1980982 RepID=A0A2R7Y9H8_9ARCH|nr:MAG: disulfide reductase [Candidatus Terraquivivens tikiterensis]